MVEFLSESVICCIISFLTIKHVLPLLILNSKDYLVKHNIAVHEGLKYPCRYCDYKTSSKRYRAQHKRAVHEGVKYPCRQCDYKATSKGNLAIQKEQFMKGGSTIAGNMIMFGWFLEC